MYSSLSPKDAFQLIKENYKTYLDKNTMTHIEAIDGDHHRQIDMEDMVRIIEQFHGLKQHYLESIITAPSMKEKLGRGVVSMLVGGAIAGGTFFASQHVSDVGNAFNPLGGAKEAVEGGFSGILGVASGALFYKLWNNLTEQGTVAEEQEVQKAMKKAGFSGARFRDLSKELVKLFHFRECLLEGMEDTTGNMRIELEMNTSAHIRQAQEKDWHQFLNNAIQIYFLQSLDSFFKVAFQNIYDFHEDQIQTQGNELAIIRRFRQYFESSEKRHRFTQQMQLEFIQTCVNFLLEQMNEKSFGANHPWFMDSVVGLIAGSLVLGAVFAVAPIPMMAVVGVAGLSFLITAALNHILFVKVPTLHYKRDRINRLGINEAIEDIQKEEQRLKALAAYVIETSDRELKELKEFNRETNPFSFVKFFGLHSTSPLLIGSSMAWEIEFSRRYNHSVTTDVDLWSLIQKTIQESKAQTLELQESLRKYLGSTEKQKKCPESLLKVLNSTRDYLLASATDDSHGQFIETFRVHQAIRQQILEVVAGFSIDLHSGALPCELIDFYTSSVTKGGLGGLASDLERVRSIAPLVDKEPIDAKHPYVRLAHIAFSLNTRLSVAPQHALILLGDAQYRGFLGLPTRPDVHLETQLKPTNIDDYLQASFDFLCSLNPYIDMQDTQDAWEKPSANTDAYNLYRMLLMRQLADLWNPTNFHIDNHIKRRIEIFVKEKLECDAAIALTAARNQALLVKPAELHAPAIKNEIGATLAITNLSAVAAALSVDMAYDVSTPRSPKYLVELAAKDTLASNESQLFFAINTQNQIQPDLNESYLNIVHQTIRDTQGFIQQLQTKDLLVKTGVLRLYIMEIKKTIEQLKVENNQYLMNLSLVTMVSELESIAEQDRQKMMQGMKDVNTALSQFTTQLDAILIAIPTFTELHHAASLQSEITKGGLQTAKGSPAAERKSTAHGSSTLFDFLKHPSHLLHVDPPGKVSTDLVAAEEKPSKGIFSGLFDHLRDPKLIAPDPLGSTRIATDSEHISTHPVHQDEIHKAAVADASLEMTRDYSGLFTEFLPHHKKDAALQKADIERRSHNATPQSERALAEFCNPKSGEIMMPTSDIHTKLGDSKQRGDFTDIIAAETNEPSVEIPPPPPSPFPGFVIPSAIVGQGEQLSSEASATHDPEHHLEQVQVDKKLKNHKGSIFRSIFRAAPPLTYAQCKVELDTFAKRKHHEEKIGSVKITSEKKQTFAKVLLAAFDDIDNGRMLEAMPALDHDTLQYAQSDKSSNLGPLLKKCMRSLGGGGDQRLEDFLKSKLASTTLVTSTAI